MTLRLANLFLYTILLLFGCSPAMAVEFFFEPDTAMGSIGQSVLLSGKIGPSPLMRGFTVYMAYDTNIIDLAESPVAGTLIANQDGLQFNYFDHPAFEPNVLEIGATIFGNDLWQGPGELFRVRFSLRLCNVEHVSAPFAPFFVAADGSYPAVIYHPATVIVCPGTPVSPAGLTIYPNSESSVMLHWPRVRQNIAGQPLPMEPLYRINRQQILPVMLPVEVIATINDTSFRDDVSTGTEYIYHVTAQSAP
jgi:hypothetical protein